MIIFIIKKIKDVIWKFSVHCRICITMLYPYVTPKEYNIIDNDFKHFELDHETINNIFMAHEIGSNYSYKYLDYLLNPRTQEMVDMPSVDEVLANPYLDDLVISHLLLSQIQDELTIKLFDCYSTAPELFFGAIFELRILLEIPFYDFIDEIYKLELDYIVNHQLKPLIDTDLFSNLEIFFFFYLNEDDFSGDYISDMETFLNLLCEDDFSGDRISDLQVFFDVISTDYHFDSLTFTDYSVDTISDVQRLINLYLEEGDYLWKSHYKFDSTVEGILDGVQFLDLDILPYGIYSTHFKYILPEITLIIGLIFFTCYFKFFSSNWSVRSINIMSFLWTTILLIATVIYYVLLLPINSKHVLFYDSIIITENLIYLKILLVIINLMVLIGSFYSITNVKGKLYEYPLMLGYCTFFIMLLLSSGNFITFYLSIEGLSLVLYVLTAYPFNTISFEAAVKYYTGGAFVSTLMLYSILLIYSSTGTLNYIKLSLIQEYSYTTMVGISLMSLSLLFKLGAFFSHMFTLDVYEGTWVVNTFFYMTVVKFGIYFTFTGLLYNSFFNGMYFLQPLLIYTGLGSLFIGSLGSLTQLSLKRLLGYSSLSQLGYILMALSTGTENGLLAANSFFIVYIMTTIGLFTVILNTRNDEGNTAINITDLRGLYNNDPRLGLSIVFFLISFSGLPIFIGFYTKLIILRSLIESKFFIQAIMVIIFSVINSFIYIRLVKIICFDINTNSTLITNIRRNKNKIRTSIDSKVEYIFENLCVFIIILIVSLVTLVATCPLNLEIFNYWITLVTYSIFNV